MEQQPLVEKDECISCVICVQNCPQVFRLDARGKSVCYNPEGASEEEIRRAIEGCPISCIAWTDKAA